MKIINLIAENVKKLTAVDITPTENMVRIIGKNGAGKSSILDAITMALCGGKAIPSTPIKKGKDKGKIKVDLGDHVITRSFTKENSYLKIESKDGSIIKSPQAFLDKIVGNVSFDPLEFLNNESRKQRDILLNILGVDVDEIDAREKGLRESRTEVGREQVRLKAFKDTMEIYPQDLPTEEISIQSLSVKLKETLDWNSNLQAEIAANENLKALAKRDLERLAQIQKEAISLEEKTKAMAVEALDLKKSIDEKKALYISNRNRLNNTRLEDPSYIEKEMTTIETTNAAIRGKREWRRVHDELQRTNKAYDSYSQKISDIAVERSEALSGKTMPVEGLSFDDGGLLYNGIPLDMASDGEKLMVSLGISMALNPTLRVLRIKDGSLLDPTNREIIDSMIKEKDYQLWFESVGEDASVGILIEEGEITKVDGKPVNTLPKSNATTITAQASQDGSASSIGAEEDWPAIKTPEAKPEDEGW